LIKLFCFLHVWPDFIKLSVKESSDVWIFELCDLVFVPVLVFVTDSAEVSFKPEVTEQRELVGA